MSFGAANDPELTRKVARAAGEEFAAMGINLVQAPIVDVLTYDGRKTMKSASFGEDVGLVCRHALAMMKGFQEAGIASMGKHFPGYGSVATDAHKGLAEIIKSFEELDRIDIEPMKVLFANGVNGVMTGQGDGTFAPDKTLQRCEMAKLLWNMAGNPEADRGAMAGFPDYADDQWYSTAMAWAFSEGVITGYENGRLGVSDPVTREQFVTMAWRLEGRPAGTGDLSAFPDESLVNEFSREALEWAVGEGIITGDRGNLSPTKGLSRAEAATMLMRWRG